MRLVRSFVGCMLVGTAAEAFSVASTPSSCFSSPSWAPKPSHALKVRLGSSCSSSAIPLEDPITFSEDLTDYPHRIATVLATFAGHIYFLTTSVVRVLQQPVAAPWRPLLPINLAYLAADAASGLLHWSVDNYGSAETPVFGGMIASFRYHHQNPAAMRDRSVWYGLYHYCVPFGILPFLLLLPWLPAGSMRLGASVFCQLGNAVQEVHRGAHQGRHWVGRVAPKEHARHHMAPYESKYCTISGLCNGVLDRVGLFRLLEGVVYRITGVRPYSDQVVQD